MHIPVNDGEFVEKPVVMPRNWLALFSLVFAVGALGVGFIRKKGAEIASLVATAASLAMLLGCMGRITALADGILPGGAEQSAYSLAAQSGIGAILAVIFLFATVCVSGFFLCEPWLAIREELTVPKKIMFGILPIAAILAAWTALTWGEPENRFFSALILPSPLEVIQQFIPTWFEAALSRSAMLSIGRVIGGFLVALLITLPLGILMGSFTKTRALFEPLMIFGSYLPIPALVPLTMCFFGTDEKQKVMFLALAFSICLLPAFVRAISKVDEVFLQTAQTLGASKWQIVRHVLVGISMSDLYEAMRQGFGIGWTYIIVAEMLDLSGGGIGTIIEIARRRAIPGRVYLSLLIIVTIAFIADKLWVWAGKFLFPYREEA
ncbi:MAG: ABC transporter permease subunit [Candidatus Sumerlaeota bacterium]|nr:ABC transporter permease subunit [Candidatus Sumerlaeota bacterium]